MNVDLEGRKAMVVGAEFEAGGAIALALAEAGADVAVCAIQPDESVLRSRKVKRAIEAMDRRSTEYVMDVMLGRNVQVTTRQVAKEMGGLDIVVSAGELPLEAALDKITETDLARVVALNFSSHLFVIRSAAAEFARNEERDGSRGRLLLVARDRTGTPGMSAVVGAQAGALQLVREAGREFADASIQMNALSVALGAPAEAITAAALDLTVRAVTGQVVEVS
jgi:NAD(P)-dependent dehydrogenase (short-subunit alcohol dehydrogenase family)